jgi:hypothetical protein
MLPDEIRELMNQMNQPKLAHVLPADEDDDGSRTDSPATATRELSCGGEHRW